VGSGTRSDPSTGRAPAEVSVVPDRRHPRLTYRRDVDGLRAVAIVLVVLFHAGVGVVPGGYVGVDVFFVISGFLITGLLVGELRHRRVSLSAFCAASAVCSGPRSCSSRPRSSPRSSSRR
jgi:hypothetical protein